MVVVIDSEEVLTKKVRETKKKRFPLPVLFVFADNAKSFSEYFYVVKQ